MQQFALFVTKSPFDSRNAESAYMFCEAALAMGYEITSVFFYQQGIHNASSLLDMPSDEISMKDKWTALHQQYGVPLHVCVTAASRRGLADDAEGLRQSSQATGNLNTAFNTVGMSEYFAALHDKNIKSIQF